MLNRFQVITIFKMSYVSKLLLKVGMQLLCQLKV